MKTLRNRLKSHSSLSHLGLTLVCYLHLSPPWSSAMHQTEEQDVTCRWCLQFPSGTILDKSHTTSGLGHLHIRKWGVRRQVLWLSIMLLWTWYSKCKPISQIGAFANFLLTCYDLLFSRIRRLFLMLKAQLNYYSFCEKFLYYSGWINYLLLYNFGTMFIKLI